MIVWIPMIVFSSFIIAIIYLMKNDKSNDEIKKVYAKIDAAKLITKEIGNIQIADELINSVTENQFIKLNNLSRILKYTDSDKYWIEFYIENNTLENLNFNLKHINLYLNNKKIQCDLILLFEKVPEHFAPPYGNRYYNIEFFNNYFLGERAQKFFRFLGRFDLAFENYNFKDSDYVEILVEFNRIENGEFIEFEKITFIESFKNIAFRKIHSINDKIEWLND